MTLRCVPPRMTFAKTDRENFLLGREGKRETEKGKERDRESDQERQREKERDRDRE